MGSTFNNIAIGTNSDLGGSISQIFKGSTFNNIAIGTNYFSLQMKLRVLLRINI